MQAAPLFPDTRLVEIHRRLTAYYGKPRERDAWNPLKQFIYSLLVAHQN
jgi:endonuclease-3